MAACVCSTWRPQAGDGSPARPCVLSIHCAELEAQREITQVAGDLYRFQNNFHVLVFVVTPEGVIATDPIDANAAAWLRGQIQEQFKQPIRYVIYSHDHADHIAGGAGLKEAGATVIAHENA